MILPPPLPRVDEANDVIVEPIEITRIQVLSSTQSITSRAIIWNVWFGSELRTPFATREDAVAAAALMAADVSRPAWVRADANQPWELIPVK